MCVRRISKAAPGFNRSRTRVSGPRRGFGSARHIVRTLIKLTRIVVQISLESSNHRSSIHRSWLQRHLSAMHQLPCRHISHICCQCNSREHFSTKFIGNSISIGCAANVLQSRSWASDEHIGRIGVFDAACASDIHALRFDTEENVEVRSGRGLSSRYSRKYRSQS